VAVAWKATPLGEVASSAGFDLLLVHQAAQRVGAADPCDHPVIAHWAVDDYIAQEKDQAKWHQALEKWLDEVDAHKFKLPTKCRGDFERRLEDLSRVCLLYEKAANLHIADPRRAPVAVTCAWVARASEIHNARAVARADGKEADQEFDELVSCFRSRERALRTPRAARPAAPTAPPPGPGRRPRRTGR
jgi:hypothetical protein